MVKSISLDLVLKLILKFTCEQLLYFLKKIYNSKVQIIFLGLDLNKMVVKVFIKHTSNKNLNRLNSPPISNIV